MHEDTARPREDVGVLAAQGGHALHAADPFQPAPFIVDAGRELERLPRDSPLPQRLELRYRLGHGSRVAPENGRQCVGEGVSVTLGNAALNGHRSFRAADPGSGVGQGV
jgi:hypothetical protein